MVADKLHHIATINRLVVRNGHYWSKPQHAVGGPMFAHIQQILNNQNRSQPNSVSVQPRLFSCGGESALWSRLKMAFKPGRRKYKLTSAMCLEIERLGLERDWFQWVVDQEGLEFGRFALDQRLRESRLFDKWYPRLNEFVAEKRSQHPLPAPGSMENLDEATFRILKQKIVDAERVPCQGNFTVAFFSAPLHLLSFVASAWPSAYRHPVFVTRDELAEWQAIYEAGEPDQESWWFVFQDWDANLRSPTDSNWPGEIPLQQPDNLTLVLVVWGLCWGSLAGGHQSELWGIDPEGNETFLQCVDDVTY